MGGLDGDERRELVGRRAQPRRQRAVCAPRAATHSQQRRGSKAALPQRSPLLTPGVEHLKRCRVGEGAERLDTR